MHHLLAGVSKSKSYLPENDPKRSKSLPCRTPCHKCTSGAIFVLTQAQVNCLGTGKKDKTTKEGQYVTHDEEFCFLLDVEEAIKSVFALVNAIATILTEDVAN